MPTGYDSIFNTIFISKMVYPEFDMSGGDEGDSQAILTLTLNFDWAGPEKPNALSL